MVQRDAYDELLLDIEMLLLRYKSGDETWPAFDLARKAAAYCGIFTLADIPKSSPYATAALTQQGEE